MTLTLDCIQNARKIICLVLGTSKASIMKELFFSEQGQAYPAAKVGSGRASILYILDKGAASLFPEALLSKVSC
jgi:6-phosphogluconolactonase/glucosamine-6-phosphate isomerase/deaminase